MDRLSFIGRGSAFTKNETNNSAYVIIGETLVLFDCGGDVFKKIINYSIINDTRIRNLLIMITHMHDDHVGSLMSLLEYCRYSNNASNIENVYLYNSILDLMEVVPASPYKNRLDSYMNQFGMSVEWLRKVKVISSSEVKDILGFEVRAISVPHCSLSYAYLVTDEKTKEAIYYSGDCKDHNALALLFEKVEMRGYFIQCYLECSTNANYYAGSVHYPENNLPSLLVNLCHLARSSGITYRVNLMHIDDFDSYKEFSKKLIVSTIDNIKDTNLEVKSDVE